MAEKKHKTFDDIAVNKPLPVAKECCLAEDFYVNTSNKSMFLDLEKIRSDYKSNWDGEGAKPIDNMVYSNCLEIINDCDNSILNKWELSLNINGSVYFSAKKGEASINLGNYTFSYYIMNGDQLDYSNCETYNSNSVINVLGRLQ